MNRHKAFAGNRVNKTFPVLIILSLITFSQSLQAQNRDINIVKAINPENPDSKYFRITSSSVYVIGIGGPVAVLTAGLISEDPFLKRKSYEMFGAALL
jgi:hypothetical protein